MNPLIAETIGYVGGLCTAFCFMPQTLKTIRTKDVQSLSLVVIFFIVSGFYLGCYTDFTSIRFKWWFLTPFHCFLPDIS